jgi:uncharacterized protein (TIGR02246 family)
MQEPKRPTLSLSQANDPVRAFVHELQVAIDTGNADHFNRRFAKDVLWGSPFGAVAVGFDQIHAIHARMFASVVPVKGAARYVVEHAQFPTEDVAVAYVRRVAVQPPETPHTAPPEPQSTQPSPARPGTFDELALLVLVQRDGQWWLAAAQHVPDRRDVYAKP